MTNNTTEWWLSHENLVLVADHLAERGDTPQEIAYFVEKPWKFEDAYNAAVEAQEAQTA